MGMVVSWENDSLESIEVEVFGKYIERISFALEINQNLLSLG